MTVHNFVARMQKKKTKAKNKQRKKKENLKDNICMLFKLIFVKKKIWMRPQTSEMENVVKDLGNMNFPFITKQEDKIHNSIYTP